LKVGDIMRSGARNAVAHENFPVKEALMVMTRAKSGSLSVTNAKGKLVGVFTDGDFRRHMALDGNLLALTSRDLARAISMSDAVAVRAARRSARYTGLAIGGVVNLLDPAVVVIGGGIAEALGQRYVEWARQVAVRQILASSAREMPIIASMLGDDAGLLGAALTAFAGLANS